VVLLAVCGAAGLAVYAGMLRLLRVDEALFIWQRLAGRLRRNG
jgi:hypothetical protein